MKRYVFVLSLLFLATQLEGKRGEIVDAEGVKQIPWFTGPLLCPSGHVVPVGHQNYEPYLYYSVNQDKYNSHWAPHSIPRFKNFLVQGSIQLGVATATEFDLAPQFEYNNTQGQHMWRVSDIPFVLAFQIVQDTPDGWWPAIKLRFAANLPIGKYDHLHPQKLGTDAGGSGCWSPGVGLVFTRLFAFHLETVHFLAVRYFLGYGITAPLHVHGLSTYGGTTKTKGTVYPGSSLNSILGLEYSLTQSWALALDVAYSYAAKTRFSGKSGGSAPVSPSSSLFSLAPAIEYNFSPNIGIIAGPWFTVAGRNRPQFMQGVLAVNIYH